MSSCLLPAERMALTVAKAQVERGDNPPINTTTVLVMALERLTAADATSAARKARRLWPDGIEALVISQRGVGDYRLDVNLGHADDLVADDLDYETALGIAHALDVVYGCGVYEDGKRL